jgi:hypothetical protein
MGFKPVDTLTTIGEEKHPFGNMNQGENQHAPYPGLSSETNKYQTSLNLLIST